MLKISLDANLYDVLTTTCDTRYATTPLPETTLFAPEPMFDYRGLQPFHDFPEGPDWWDTQHYKQIITQLSKMKANFIGLHTYP